MLWWLSYADPAKPPGEQFLGIAVVEAPTFAAAMSEAWRRGANPGGECRGFPLADERVPPEARNRLLPRAEMQRLGLI